MAFLPLFSQDFPSKLNLQPGSNQLLEWHRRHLCGIRWAPSGTFIESGKARGLQGLGIAASSWCFFCISKTPNGSEKYGKTWKYHQNNLLETRFYLFRDGDLYGYSSLLWQVEAVSFMNPPSTIGCLVCVCAQPFSRSYINYIIFGCVLNGDGGVKCKATKISGHGGRYC